MKTYSAILIILITTILGCQNPMDREYTLRDKMNEENDRYEFATFAGGCFWCVESDFEKNDGVIEVISGYTGGEESNPTYDEVASGQTGHVEAIQVKYDPQKISYDELLDIFWRHVDPTDPGGQFADRGPQYRTAIFYHNDDQRLRIEKSKEKLLLTGPFKNEIVTEIRPLKKF